MKFLKENRIASFLVVTLVYVIINETNANFLSVLFLLISLMASIMQGVAYHKKMALQNIRLEQECFYQLKNRIKEKI